MENERLAMHRVYISVSLQLFQSFSENKPRSLLIFSFVRN